MVKFKIRVPATVALEMEILEVISRFNRKTIYVKNIVYQISLTTGISEDEIIDGIKDMVNRKKLCLGLVKMTKSTLLLRGKAYTLERPCSMLYAYCLPSTEPKEVDEEE